MSTVTIRINHPDGRAEDRVLPPGSYRIGRESGEIVLHDPNVSANHARLDVGPGGVTIVDLGSSNGTLDAEGRRLTGPYALERNAPIRLGGSTLTWFVPSGPPPAPAPFPGAGVHSGPPFPGAPFPGPGYGAYPPSPEVIELRRRADRWMLLAILSVFCGCGLPGIINIVLASQAKSAVDQGDLAAANSKIGTVKILCLLGWGAMALSLLILVIVYGGLFAAMLAGASSTPRHY
ncbi:MAG: FHA domain-containing protein [Myxococcota bacterium]|nr:FHA domain-containing protein [Myxococcota bacterium]